jgi:hypothetical protein
MEKEVTMLRFMLTTVCVLFTVLAQAQELKQSWENLRTLQVGERIQVVDQRLKSQNGMFLSVSDEALTFRVEQDEVAIPRADVFRVTSREQTKRKRNALIGAAIGAGVGGLAAALIGASLIGEVSDEEFVGGAVVPGVALGAGVFGVLGAAVPSYQTIYRAERRQNSSVP